MQTSTKTGPAQVDQMLRRRLGLASHVADDDTQDPAVHQEEAQRREPEARQEGAPAQELQLVALLQPQRLRRNPQRQRGDAQPLVPEERRPGQVQREQHHVPEEVLRARPPFNVS